MRQKNVTWKVVILSAWLVWLLDVGSKTWAMWRLRDGSSFQVIGNFLKLNLARNSGAAFSMATGGSGFLAAFSIAVVLVIVFWMMKINSLAWSWVLGLVLGGCLGNLSDRFFRSSGEPTPSAAKGFFSGRVVDWIELPHWPIFNIADSAIVAAAVIAAILSVRNIAPISRPTTGDKNGS